MENKEIKEANRKAMPKFLLILAVSGIGGGIVGYLCGWYGVEGVTTKLKEFGSQFGTAVAPWLMAAIAVVLPAIGVPIYRSARKALSGWDGEDEEVSDLVEKKLSALVWLTSGAMILAFFLLAASYSGGFSLFKNSGTVRTYFLSIVAFLAVLTESVLLHQKCVDTSKVMNPEKNVSVYDMKFQEKWMEQCDEAERLLIGKCAVKAYTATNKTCGIMAGVLAVCALLFDTGFLPSLAVCMVWAVNLSAYCREAYKYSKAGSMIS